MNKRTVLIAAGVGAALLGVIVLTLFLLSEQQDTRSRATDQTISTPIPTQPLGGAAQQSCPTPSQVQNVQVEFPNCVGDVCNFTEASCTWNSVAGATQYDLTITEVETGTVVRDEQVQAATTRVEFAINQNHTYKCDVAAINSCGTSGPAGSHSLFCEVDALVATPTPEPPTATPVPLAACGFPCTSTSGCETGYTCALDTSGQGYCAIPTLEGACIASPSAASCCTVPTNPAVTNTPAPTIAPTGSIDSAITIGIASVLLLILGFALFTL